MTLLHQRGQTFMKKYGFDGFHKSMIGVFEYMCVKQ